jgi:hypothetical protein
MNVTEKKLTAFFTNVTKHELLLNDRISSANSQDTDPSLLLNGHFDSPLGSPGAGDCGSCVGGYNEKLHLLDLLYFPLLLDWFTFSSFFFVVLYFAASLLEVARLTVDSGWVPPRPIVFLFNGAEELFLLVRHHGSALFGSKIIFPSFWK